MLRNLKINTCSPLLKGALGYVKITNTFIFRFLILLLFFSSINNVVAQKLPLDSIKPTDTLNIKVEKPHSPTKATIMSAALPGLGQVYNKKYWKVPIIWGGIGTSLYFGFSNQKSFTKFRKAYGNRIDDDPSTTDEYEDVLSPEGLKANMDYHQKNRDLSFVIAGVLYILNVVDAAVDAHLFNFPKNDKLSFNLQPSLNYTNNNRIAKGFRLVITL